MSEQETSTESKSAIEIAEENLEKAQKASQNALENENNDSFYGAEINTLFFQHKVEKLKLEELRKAEFEVAKKCRQQGDGIGARDSLRKIALIEYEKKCSSLEWRYKDTITRISQLSEKAGETSIIDEEIQRCEKKADVLRGQLSDLKQNRQSFIQQKISELKLELNRESDVTIPNAKSDIRGIAEEQKSRDLQKVTEDVKGYYNETMNREQQDKTNEELGEK